MKKLMLRFKYWYQRMIYELLMRDFKDIEARIMKTEKEMLAAGFSPCELLWIEDDLE